MIISNPEWVGPGEASHEQGSVDDLHREYLHEEMINKNFHSKKNNLVHTQRDVTLILFINHAILLSSTTENHLPWAQCLGRLLCSTVRQLGLLLVILFLLFPLWLGLFRLGVWVSTPLKSSRLHVRLEDLVGDGLSSVLKGLYNRLQGLNCHLLQLSSEKSAA